MLIKPVKFGLGYLEYYICFMFKELLQNMLNEGWRCYYFADSYSSVNKALFQSVARKRKLHITIFEDKPFVFIKDKHEEN